jgi:hypothetical protein
MMEMGIVPELSGVLPKGRSASPSIPKVKERISASPARPAVRLSPGFGVSIHFKVGLEQAVNKDAAKITANIFFIY